MIGGSDPNHRPLKVLNFLAAHATESFSLAEISRLLNLAKGSAHRVMIALTESGFVARHPRHKTYSLGIGMVALGQAALERYPGVNLAKHAMARLREDLGIGLGATAIVNDQYLLLAREGLPRTQDGLTIVGERRHLMPTIGIGQMAWRSDAEVDAWLKHGAGYLSNEQRTRIWDSLPVIRKRGYSIAANGSGMNRIVEATVIHTEHLLPGDEAQVFPAIGGMRLSEFQALDLSEVLETGANYIAAPAFGPDGEIALEIVASALPDLPSVGAWQDLVKKITDAAESISADLRGRKPEQRQ